MWLLITSMITTMIDCLLSEGKLFPNQTIGPKTQITISKREAYFVTRLSENCCRWQLEASIDVFNTKQ